MKNWFILITSFIFINSIIAQDINLYQTWYLYQLEADLEGVIWDIEDVQPEFSPYLTINNDLTFDGIGACNGFSGHYTYNSNQDTLFPNNVYFTLGNCDTSEEISFENLFFPYVEANTYHTITLATIEDYMELKLENFLGYVAVYRNISLSILEESLPQVKIYPNPVSNKLHISHDNIEVLEIIIYDIYGKLIQREKIFNEPADVSKLIDGIYFLEVHSEKGKVIRKFIKN